MLKLLGETQNFLAVTGREDLEEPTGEVDFEAETETVDAVDIVAVETVVNGTEETMTVEAVETKAADEVNGTVETEKAFAVVVDTVRGQA